MESTTNFKHDIKLQIYDMYFFYRDFLSSQNIMHSYIISLCVLRIPKMIRRESILDSSLYNITLDMLITLFTYIVIK